MATVQTLKDKDNNTFYPVTKTEAVYNADGSKTLDHILDHTIIASEDPADANKVFKGNASLGLVEPENINWSAFSNVGCAHVGGTDVAPNTDLPLIDAMSVSSYSVESNRIYCNFTGGVFVLFNGGFANEQGARITLNGVEQTAFYTTGLNASMTMARVLNVTQGDYISIQGYSAPSNPYPYSYLYVFRIN